MRKQKVRPSAQAKWVSKGLVRVSQIRTDLLVGMCIICMYIYIYYNFHILYNHVHIHATHTCTCRHISIQFWPIRTLPLLPRWWNLHGWLNHNVQCPNPYEGFLKWGTPKSSILIRFSIRNHPAIGVPPWLWNPRHDFFWSNPAPSRSWESRTIAVMST